MTQRILTRIFGCVLVSLFAGSTAATPVDSATAGWQPHAPFGRYGHSMAYDAARGETVLFGGTGGVFGTLAGDTWVWNGVTWARKHPLNSPSPRRYSAMVYDAARSEVVLFGGHELAGAPLNDTWVWNGSNWTEKTPSRQPSPRLCAGVAYDAAREEVLLFGGLLNATDRSDETWIWNGADWTRAEPPTAPPALQQVGMAFDAAHSEVVMFGGGRAPFPTFSNETWLWDGTTWRQAFPSTSPSARLAAHVAYDSLRGEIVLFGGSWGNCCCKGDTWTWDGLNWTEQPVRVGPSPRGEGALVYDSQRDEMVLFSGWPCADALPDTWTWRTPPPVELK